MFYRKKTVDKKFEEFGRYIEGQMESFFTRHREQTRAELNSIDERSREAFVKESLAQTKRHEKHVTRMEAHAEQVEQYLFTQTNLVRTLMEKLIK